MPCFWRRIYKPLLNNTCAKRFSRLKPALQPMFTIIYLPHPTVLNLPDLANFVRNMMEEQKNNPLHGKTLEMILVLLVDYYGWEELGYKININSFNKNPSIKSSLKFLRKTPWARQKVEDLYVHTFHRG